MARMFWQRRVRMARISSPSGDSYEELAMRARHQRSVARRPFSWFHGDSDEQNMRPRHKRSRLRRTYEEETEEEEEESYEYGGEEETDEYRGGEETDEYSREEESDEYRGEEVEEEERDEYGAEVGRESEEERDFDNHIDEAEEEEEPDNEAQLHEQKKDGSQSHVSITLTDPELFDCSICCEPLTIPVYQCDQNGHIACSSCCAKINNKCPICSGSIGSSRCRAIEKALESIKTSCQNIEYGCKECVTFHKKGEHLNACVYSPCYCPNLDCNFVSSAKQLYQHFSSSHANSAIQFKQYSLFPVSLNADDNFLVLQAKNDGILFILKRRCVEDLGNIVTISCIQPGFMEGFFYQIHVKLKQNSLRLESYTESTPSRGVIDGRPHKTGFLLIPSDLISPDGKLRMDILIGS